MKKRVLIAAVVLLAILVIPIPTGVFQDGGTRTYTALTYKIVRWNRLLVEDVYSKTSVYPFPLNFRSLDTLWYREVKNGLRNVNYEGQWLSHPAKLEEGKEAFGLLIITKIYKDCFFATPMGPADYQVKLNMALSKDFCVGDQVLCTLGETLIDGAQKRVEAEVLYMEPYRADPNAVVAYKPVIYLYPEREMEVQVSLELQGQLTCTYPLYQEGWQVIAAPDGTLRDVSGQIYNYLYWEGETSAAWNMGEGFCVKGTDTAAFLETALEQLGLTRREANEFIVFWLPLMQENPYNIISFQTERYTEVAKLNVSPEPDTLIRVFMVWKGQDAYCQLPAQILTAPERDGFTVVEWGGTELE